MARILVVDDDPRIIAFLRRGLTHEGFIVEEAHGGGEALSRAQSRPPDLVVLDIMMPDLDGLSVCRELRREAGNIPILMLTARDEVVDRVRGLEAGADDYLVKPFAFEELLARIRALLRRSGLEGDTVRFADLILDLENRVARRGKREIQLTTKEFDLLQLFMRNARRVLGRDTIMERVWGYDFEGESNVLEVYVGNLRQKTETDGESRLIHTVRGVGYILRE